MGQHDLDAPEKAGEDVHEESKKDHQGRHLAYRRSQSVRNLISGHAVRTHRCE